MTTNTATKTAEEILEHMKQAHDTLDLALQDMEEADNLARKAGTSLPDKARLEIIKQAKIIADYAKFVLDRADDLECAVLYRD